MAVVAWTFDGGVVRAGYRSAALTLVATSAVVPEDAWDRFGIGVWSVRDLVGHASRALATVADYLDGPISEPVTLAHPVDYYTALPATRVDPEAVAERGRQAGRDLGDDPTGALGALAERVLARVDAEPDDAPVATPAGVMRLIDYLPSRVFELTVHRIDICRALGLDHGGQGPEFDVAVALAAGVAAAQHEVPAVLLALTGRRPLPASFSVV